jgi:hypothetical protein
MDRSAARDDRTEDVAGLRDDEPAETTTLKSFKLPASAIRYLEAAAGNTRTMTRVIVDALAVDEQLEHELKDRKAELKAAAADLELSYSTDLGRVLALLVREALGARAKRPQRK